MYTPLKGALEALIFMKTQTDAWWQPYATSGVFPSSLIDYAMLESQAAVIEHVSGVVIPGLLQTEHYMQALQSLLPAAIKQRLQTKRGECFVEFRLARQWQLFERDVPPQLHVVIGEGALRQVVGNASIMYEQIQHIRELAQLPHVTVQVLPFCAHLPSLFMLSAASAVLLTDARHQKTLSVEQYLGNSDNSTNYHEIMAFESELLRLKDQAATPEATLGQLDKIAQEFRYAGLERKNYIQHEDF